MASAGNGSQQHVAGELFKMMTGVSMVHVPYRGGGPALTDLLGGQVQLYFGTTASTIEYIKTGKLRVERHVLQLDAEVFRDRLAAGEDGDVLQHRLAAVAEARRLHRRDLEAAAQLVDYERGERLTLDVLGDAPSLTIAWASTVAVVVPSPA
jgi:Tripartite tricarboxylate transporter family receptor